MDFIFLIILFLFWIINLYQTVNSRFVGLPRNWRLLLRIIAIFAPTLSVVTVWFRKT